MRPELRYEHMAHSAVHDADTKHYNRSLVDQTCSHLLEDMARCIGWHRIEKNRSRHASSYQEMSRGEKRHVHFSAKALGWPMLRT